MREIKIRIFDKKNKKILEVDTLFINEGMFKPVGGDEYSVWNYDTEYYSNPMQYTGLKDKNGVEIYEGDILELTNFFNNEISIHPVSFTLSAFVCKRVEDDEFSYFYLQGNKHLQQGYRVIGNIYENKELLNTDG